MKEGFRQCMAWLHTWTGLVVGWVLFFVFVTGTAGYFDDEITRWMQPEQPLQQAQSFPDKGPLIEHALNRLEQVAPVAASWNITLPHQSLAPRGWQELSIRWAEMPRPGHERGASGSERLDPATGAVLPPEVPAGGATRQTQSVLLALHEGLFATGWGRWLYFIAGLLGCVMIGTGLVLWTVKRRKQHLDAPQPPLWEDFGVRLVETLNVATLARLPVAVAAYFWANRLLPVAMTDRAEWELHTLFAVWLSSLFYAMARPLHRAWIELLWGACAAFVLVPLINAVTTDKHLGNTVAHGDWVLIGVDLTLAGLAVIFAVMAVKVGRRFSPAGAGRRQSAGGDMAVIEQGAV